MWSRYNLFQPSERQERGYGRKDSDSAQNKIEVSLKDWIHNSPHSS